ncbi:Carboxypeptidase regulatory-like domain-containing protein [Sinosporangium album]|uniref:alpha-amylase n=1 Tax=Sinosporangium album TaxID=504805 RepID=A0A1G7W0Z2_9ACTN|nr:S8 family serine peptidase [Sinosporangium album]SDG65528.1 Carboxypeptidase regulatory-like domain-containing protein [Sinosporangium album]
MSHTSRRWRTALIAAALAFLLPYGTAYGATSGATSGAASGTAQAAPEPDKISKTLAAELVKSSNATFLVYLNESADLSAAARATTKTGKAAQVLKAKTARAETSQAGLRALLASRKAEFTPYWIANAVKVTGDADLAAEIAKLPEVRSVELDRTIPLPPPAKGTTTPMPTVPMPTVPKPVTPKAAGAVEWNVERVGAPKVWNEYGVRGEGVVVANIDSGVQFDHPALADRYRGKKPDGTVDHNHNYYDSTGECTPAVPCTSGSHGTHTMGTMVGGSAGDAVGVAPGATWIAVKACSATDCASSALLAAGQWVLAPTDAAGRNPRPDLAPDVVNNSWGGPAVDPWFKPAVDAWVAAGIFPAFSGGNTGPGCQSTGSPGADAPTYSAGAFDATDRIADFSSRGSGANGELKPNIAAPGVDIRSSVPGGGYELNSGTSMASPHVAATVALLWSAAPTMKGDVAATRALLDRSAADLDDTTCGGTAAKNNVWGEGRLDAYQAVRAAPIGQIGGLKGTVTSAGAPLDMATVTLAGPLNRTVVTGKDGAYALPRLPAGDYRVTARKVGYGGATATVAVAAGRTAVHDVPLSAQPTHAVSGTVTTDGGPEAGATLTVAGTMTSAVTDAQGRYRLDLESGDHTLEVAPGTARCAGPATVAITVSAALTKDSVSAALTKDIVMPRRTDTFGYGCVGGAAPFTSGTDKLPFSGSAPAPIRVALPFAFPFYGDTYRGGWVAPNGFLTFLETAGARENVPLPTSDSVNAAIYPFWDDLRIDAQSGVYTAAMGTAPTRTFVVEWRNVYLFQNNRRLSFSLLLGENGSIKFQYRGVGDALTAGEMATVGIEDGSGTDAFLFSYNTRALSDGQNLTFTTGRHGLLTGAVTDANDGHPLGGATVTVGDAAKPGAVMTFTTADDGTFVGYVPPGDHGVTVEREHYGSVAQTVTVTVGAWTRADASLVTGSVSASVSEIDLTLPAGSTKSAVVTLTNVGRSAAAFTAAAEPGQRWLSAAPATGEIAPGGSVTVTVTVDSAGLYPGAFRHGKLLVRSASGRSPQVEIPVTMAVPRHQVAVDAGGTRDITDAAGDRWSADRAYTPGSFGYMGARTRVVTTDTPVKDTAEQDLFSRARESMAEYRFDKVPVGVYSVELGFADLRATPPGGRVFDVLAEGRLAVPVLDLAQEVGVQTATTRRYTVKVTDGQLNLRFAVRTGTPIVNAIRITERPDKTAP